MDTHSSNQQIELVAEFLVKQPTGYIFIQMKNYLSEKPLVTSELNMLILQLAVFHLCAKMTLAYPEPLARSPPPRK